MSSKIRVRFAPSPTGPLHMGGVRTALYNYLFARKLGGKFILRIEDTDSNRFVEGAEDYINESLAWCGITIDEGVREGGEYGPYRQSERKEIYLKYAMQLIENDQAYYAFDTPQELDAIRAEKEAAGETFAYNFAVREKMTTSLSLSAQQVKERIERGDQWVVRFKMPENEDVVMDDLIRGRVVINTSTQDDKVLYKSADSLPTYHLANIVDDHLMEISHVIRGEEWLPSLPLHYKLYQAFGWSESQPQFAHLPLLLKPTGKGKLSKRDGDKLGFPVFPLLWTSGEGETSRGYREDGYLPEAFINMLALLGWNPGTEQEIMSMDELIDLFSLEKVGKSGSRFDPEKTKWFNAQYLHSNSNAQIYDMMQPIFVREGLSIEQDKAEKMIGFMKERAGFVEELFELCRMFFFAPSEYDQKGLKKFWKGEAVGYVAQVREMMASFEDFSTENTEAQVLGWIRSNELPMGQIMNCVRLAITGVPSGPNIFEVCQIIGQQETLSRLDKALATLS